MRKTVLSFSISFLAIVLQVADMNRRTYLVSVATLTAGAGAGCLGIVSSRSTNRKRKTVSVSDVTRTTPKSMENVDQDEQPTNLVFDVVVNDDTITADSTAKVTLKYTNEGSDTLKLNINPNAPVPVSSVDTNPGLILVSEAYDPKRTSNSCWKPRRDAFAVPAAVYQYPIEPGQTANLSYRVWAAPKQNADCIKPGTYQFDPLYGSFAMTVKRDKDP